MRATVEREQDLERFLTLVDAIVAIALTLLVLPLVDLVSDLHDEGGSVARLLDDHRAELTAFALSFVVIARLWYAQHRAVRHLVAMNGWVFVALMSWSATIAFLPFPTALVAHESEQSLTKALYIGTSALSLATLAWLDWLMDRDPDLVSESSQGGDLTDALVNTGLLVAALVLAVTVPVLNYWPMLLQTLDAPIRRWQDRRRATTG